MIIPFPLKPLHLPLYCFFLSTFKLFEVTSWKKTFPSTLCYYSAATLCLFCPLNLWNQCLPPYSNHPIWSHPSTVPSKTAIYPRSSDPEGTFHSSYLSTFQHLCIFHYNVPLLSWNTIFLLPSPLPVLYHLLLSLFCWHLPNQFSNIGITERLFPFCVYFPPLRHWRGFNYSPPIWLLTICELFPNLYLKSTFFLNSRYKYISLISTCLTGTSTQHIPRWIHTLSSCLPPQRKMQPTETYGCSESSAQNESNSWKLKEKKDLKSTM